MSWVKLKRRSKHREQSTVLSGQGWRPLLEKQRGGRAVLSFVQAEGGNYKTNRRVATRGELRVVYY